MSDVTVDLGPIPLENARSLLLGLNYVIDAALLWDPRNVKRLGEVKAQLKLRIALAEKEAAA